MRVVSSKSINYSVVRKIRITAMTDLMSMSDSSINYLCVICNERNIKK